MHTIVLANPLLFAWDTIPAHVMQAQKTLGTTYTNYRETERWVWENEDKVVEYISSAFDRKQGVYYNCMDQNGTWLDEYNSGPDLHIDVIRNKLDELIDGRPCKVIAHYPSFTFECTTLQYALDRIVRCPFHNIGSMYNFMYQARQVYGLMDRHMYYVTIVLEG